MFLEKNDINSLEELKENYEKLKHNAYKYGWIGIAGMLIPVPEDYIIVKSGIVGISFFKTILEEMKLLKHYTKREENYINSVEFQDVYNSYYQILTNLAIMSDKLDWNNESKLFAGYSYLLKNGYLSVNHEFYYSPNNFNTYINIYGTNVIEGSGDCKHINSFLTDLLNTKGVQVSNILMNLTSISKRLNNDPLQELNVKNNNNDRIQKNNKLDSMIKHLYLTAKGNPNHVVTLYSNEDYSYILDATNDVFFWIDDNKKVYLDDKTYSVTTEKRFNQKVPNLSKLLKETSKEEKERILRDYHQIYNSCPECIDVFEKFYKENKELYQDVSQKKKVLIRNDKKYFETITK